MEEKKSFPTCQASFRIEHLLPRRDTQSQEHHRQPNHFTPYSMPLPALKPCVADGGTLENGLVRELGEGGTGMWLSDLLCDLPWLQAGGCSQVRSAKSATNPLNNTGAKLSRDSVDGTGKECSRETRKRANQGYSYHSSTSGNEDDDDDQFRKRKKARTAFSREQVSDLEKKFNEKKYLSSAERGELAERLKLSDMQVKTWFQNRRMKYKRQSEEAEMEMKSPKYQYSSFLPYGGMAPFYSYMQMQYKPENTMNYTYPSAVRAAHVQSHNAADATFQSIPMSSPTMISGLSSPISMSPRHPSTQQFSRPAPSGSYFTANGMLTPVSPSNSYQQGYSFTGAENATLVTGHAPTQMHLGCNDWARAVHGSPTP